MRQMLSFTKIQGALIVSMMAASAASCGSIADEELRIEVDRNVFTCEGEFKGAGGRESLAWEVSGRRVLIDWDGTAVTAGEFVLMIHDALGEEVYFGRAVGEPPATLASSAGVAGEWRIEVSYQRLRGVVAVGGLAVLD